MSVITPGVGFGSVTIGATRAQLEAALGAPAKVEEGIFAELEFPSHGVFAKLYEDRVCELAFKHASWAAGFTTPAAVPDKGLVLGTSTEADVLAAYGKPERVFDSYSFRGHYYPGIAFITRNDPHALVAVQVTEIEEEEPPKKKKRKAVELVEKDLEWFEENHENINSRPFEKVWFGDGDVKLSGSAIAALLNEETEAAIVVDGNLVVDGDLAIDDHHSVQVTGDVTCRSLRVAAGVFSCDTLKASDTVEFTADETQRTETFDVRSIVAAKIVSPHVDAMALAPKVKVTKAKAKKR